MIEETERVRGNGRTRRSDPAGPSVTDSFRRLADGLARLLKDHIALAKIELAQDLKKAGKDVALAAAGLPSLFVGYVLLMCALGFLLGNWITNAGGFAVVGVLNMALGGSLAYVFGKRLVGKDKPDMDRTASQFKEDSRWLKELRQS